MTFRTFSAGLIGALALGLASAAVAQQPPTAAGPKDEVKKMAEKRKEAMEKMKEAAQKSKEAAAKTKAGAEDAKEAREDAKEARKDAKEAREDAKEARDEAREAIKEAWKKRRENWKERRKERREEIKAKYGAITDKPAVKSELKVHAWRMARLNRMRTIAKAQDKTAVVERIDKLLEKEKARHQKHMDTLKEKGGAE